MGSNVPMYFDNDLLKPHVCIFPVTMFSMFFFSIQIDIKIYHVIFFLFVV